MDKPATDENRAPPGLCRLQRQLVAMGNMAESLFAQSVVALIEQGAGALGELRREDYQTHECWLEIDRQCLELLSGGGLDNEQVRLILATGKMAVSLKRAADESLRIAEGMRACMANGTAEVRFPPSVSRMAELIQSMLSDVLEAFINRDSAQAGALHMVFQEVTSLASGAVEEMTGSMCEARDAVPVGVTLVDIVRRLERVGADVLDIANQVSHLHRGQ